MNDFWNKKHTYVAIDGEVHETTTLRELKIALVAAPIILITATVIGTFIWVGLIIAVVIFS